MEIVKKILGLIIVLLVSSLFFMFMWNLVVPNIFGLPTISFLQSLWLLILFDTVYGFIHTGRDKNE